MLEQEGQGRVYRCGGDQVVVVEDEHHVFAPDAGRHVTCTGGCATAWPPLLVRAGQTIAAGRGVRPGLLGTAPDPAGGSVVTYRGWPLYTYLGDAAPGHAAGQGEDDDGGYWFVMRPSGQIVGN